MSTNFLRDKLHRNQMIMPWGESETISTVDAATMMQCGSDLVRELLDEGHIKGYRINPHKQHSPWRVERRSVEIYIARVLRHYDLDASKQSAGSAGTAGAPARKGPAGR